jgi:hypothetical protein
MKKSTQIQLVIITAAMASCNRLVVPQQQAGGIEADSSLIAAPVPNDSTDVDSSCVCNCQAWYPSASYSASPFGSIYYIGPVNSGYYYSPHYSSNAVWHGKSYIVRGGFGKSSGGTGS